MLAPLAAPLSQFAWPFVEAAGAVDDGAAEKRLQWPEENLYDVGKRKIKAAWTRMNTRRRARARSAVSGRQVVFGKRGASTLRPAARPAPEHDSRAYLETAAAARAAFRDGGPSGADEPSRPAVAEPSEEAGMRDYIGANWRRYRPLWLEMKGAPGLKRSRSLAAGAFASLWLLYRKQYRIGAAILAAQAAMTYEAAAWSPVFDLAVAAFLARYGKSIVVLGAMAANDRIRSAGLSPDIAAIRIAGAGGVSLIAPIVGALALAGAYLCAADGSTREYRAMLGEAQTLRLPPSQF
jgi:hypothetical protein